MVSNKHGVKMSLHDRIIVMAIISRIILLSIKFIFLVTLEPFIKRWVNRGCLIFTEFKGEMRWVWINRKPVKKSKWYWGALSLFGLGIMHVLYLLMFPRQTKAMLQK